MARGIRTREGSAPTRLHASGLRTYPAGSRQPFTRQLGVAVLATLAVVATLAGLHAMQGTPPEPARPVASSSPAPVTETKLHANPVTVPIPQPASPAPAPVEAPPAAVQAAPLPPSPAASPAPQAFTAAPPLPEAAEARPAAPAPPRSPTGNTLAEAIARGSVKPDPSAPTECLPAEFKTLIGDLSARFGRVTVVSTTQLQTDNHGRGSARHRMHQACRALDFRVEGDSRAVLRYLRARPEVSGVTTYRNDLIHIDYAERRPGTRQAARGVARAGSAE